MRGENFFSRGKNFFSRGENFFSSVKNFFSLAHAREIFFGRQWTSSGIRVVGGRSSPTYSGSSVPSILRGLPGAPRGRARCTFFWVFNNSPSRDKNLDIFRPPREGQNRGLWGPRRGTVGSLPPASSLAPVGYARVPLAPASRLAPERYGRGSPSLQHQGFPTQGTAVGAVRWDWSPRGGRARTGPSRGLTRVGGTEPTGG